MTEARLLDRVTASDRDGCPDVEVFAQGVRTALDELAERRLRPPREGTA